MISFISPVDHVAMRPDPLLAGFGQRVEPQDLAVQRLDRPVSQPGDREIPAALEPLFHVDPHAQIVASLIRDLLDIGVNVSDLGARQIDRIPRFLGTGAGAKEESQRRGEAERSGCRPA